MAEKNNVESLLASINKKFGAGTIMSLGDAKPITNNLQSTGSLMIDNILGGGIAKGRVTEIYGVESSGKSTLCMQIARECQKQGGTVMYIDVENAVDVEYAKKLGVNTDKLIFSQPTTAEEALDIADMAAQSGLVQLIIIDSVAALTPKAELDGEMSDMTIGLLARLLSKGLRKLTGTLNQQNCGIIFINQIREKIGGYSPVGPAETTPGGRALKFFASQRIELRKTLPIKQGDTVIGQGVKVKVVKNKISAPMKVAEVQLLFGEGFSAADEAIELGVMYNIIQQAGAWFTTHDGQRMQGKSAVKDYYNEHPDLKEELISKVVSTMKGETNIQCDGYEIDPETGEMIAEE